MGASAGIKTVAPSVVGVMVLSTTMHAPEKGGSIRFV